MINSLHLGRSVARSIYVVPRVSFLLTPPGGERPWGRGLDVNCDTSLETTPIHGLDTITLNSKPYPPNPNYINNR